MDYKPSMILLSGLFLLAAGGCGQDDGLPRMSIGGNVTSGGQPVAEGSILFLPTGETTGPAASGVIVDGEYQIPAEQGPVPGSYQVKVTITLAGSGGGTPGKPGMSPDEPDDAGPPAPQEVTLEETLEEGMSVLDITLPAEE